MKHSFICDKSETVGFGITIHSYRHPSGMRIEMTERSRFALFACAVGMRAGGTTIHFASFTDEYKVPPGTAHFLEHCLFKTKKNDGRITDLMTEMATLGASANAYTGTDRTVAYFGTTSRVQEALFTFLDGLAHPSLDDGFINNERAIILEELKQYQDDDSSRIIEASLQGLYHNHPLKYDIGGTPETVKQITRKHLQTMWQAFYHPSKWTISIVADFAKHASIDTILSEIELWLGHIEEAQFDTMQIVLPTEPDEVQSKQTTFYMEASAAMGFAKKLKPIEHRDNCRQTKLAYDIAYGALLSPSSYFYNSLYKAGIINDTLGGFVNITPGAMSVLMLGETRDPEQGLAYLQKTLKNPECLASSDELIRRVQKSMFGDMLRTFDRGLPLARRVVQEALNDSSLGAVLAQYDTIKISEVQSALADIVTSDKTTEVILLPYADMPTK